MTKVGAVGGGAVNAVGDVYFAGKDSERGTEVWVAQGTYATASDLRPGPESSNPSQFTSVDGYVVWVSDNGIHGPEIRGSQFLSPNAPLFDLQPGASHEAPVILGAGSGCVWFTTSTWESGVQSSALWAMTNFGYPVKMGVYAPGSITQTSVVINRQSLLFVAKGLGSSPLRLYHARGTQQVQIIDSVDPGGTGVMPSAPIYAATSTFVCYRQISGGFFLRVHDLDAGGNTTLPAQSDNTILPWFASNDTDRVCFVGASGAQGVELWTVWRPSSGGSVQSEVLADVVPGGGSSWPSRLIMSPGNPGVFFQVEEGAGRDLYFIDPAEKPAPVAHRTRSGVHASTQFVMLGAREIAVLVPLGPGGNQLWICDGSTGAGTAVMEDFGEVFRMWNPNPGIPQQRDLCMHAMTQGEESILRHTPFADPWDSWYPLARLFHSHHTEVEVFSAGSKVFLSAGYPGEEFRPPAELTLGGVSSIYMSMSSGSGSSVEPSSMPADFTECDGALLFTGGVGAQRSLYASLDGEMASATPVSGIYHVEQLVRFQDRVYMLGYDTHSGSGVKKLFEAKVMGGHVTVTLYGGTPHFVTSLAAAAGRLFFVEPGSAGVERLQSMLPDYTLADHQTFYQDTAGVGITQLTPAPGCLYFTARASSDTGAKRVVWCTDGSTAGTKKPAPVIENPQLLGVMGSTCVFWASVFSGPEYTVFFWDSATSLIPEQAGQGQMADAPEKSTVRGLPSGLTLGEYFYFTTQSGQVLRTDGHGLTTILQNGSEVVRPDTLAVLNDSLLFLSISPHRSGRLMSFSEETGPQHLYPFSQGLSPCPLQVVNGRAYFSCMGSPGRTDIWSTDGTGPGTRRPVSLPITRAAARLPMGSYRGHLVLALEQSGGGLEPALLNHTPAVPSPPLLTGARRGQPYTFTYGQLVSSPAADLDGDILSPLRLLVYDGTLMRNGTPVDTSTALAPGDSFEWLPGSLENGILFPFHLYTSDSWQEGGADVRIRVDRPVDVWAQGHFTEEELVDPSIGSPEADADGDGVANALEFVFGRNPRTHTLEPPCTPSVAEAQGGGRVVRFTFVRAAALTEGTVLTVEASPDLMPGTWQAVATKNQSSPWSGTATVTETTLPDSRVQVVVELPAPATGQTFMRLNVGL
ncbi:MAG: hypothetical protein ACO1TE_29945 [Prosthecobacter sp.]